eukprot:gnl/TRDRNA2_/TRDRNA2_171677_c0_seq4.p1 gnl/TRDRNA2_/TRDRNA2_171677_c0~~gnl/TRDRNA2_/TRDRNA2_171677_c0_seq4.p1  ORF type:complete len:180 (+),score=46.10 gnl/TRDRNA2_/TRDRNA2_171677_c0_seq4:51-590(+)
MQVRATCFCVTLCLLVPAVVAVHPEVGTALLQVSKGKSLAKAPAVDEDEKPSSGQEALPQARGAVATVMVNSELKSSVATKAALVEKGDQADKSASFFPGAVEPPLNEIKNVTEKATKQAEQELEKELAKQDAKSKAKQFGNASNASNASKEKGAAASWSRTTLPALLLPIILALSGER